MIEGLERRVEGFEFRGTNIPNMLSTYFFPQYVRFFPQYFSASVRVLSDSAVFGQVMTRLPRGQTAVRRTDCVAGRISWVRRQL